MTDKSIEERAERTIVRLPWAALAVVITLLSQIVGLAWFAATQTERLQTLAAGVQKVERKVDLMTEVQITARDLDWFRRQIDDHEARLRELERRGGRQQP